MDNKIIILIGVATCALATHDAAACGMSTHIEVAHRAAWWFDGPGYPEYAQYIARHQDAFQAGAPFPDWGYSLPDFGDASEAAHWDPFLQAAADYVYRTYPQPWDREAQRLVVFLLGAASHSVADITFHGLGVSEGFIDLMAAQDFQGDWSEAHDFADTGGDMVVAYELDQSYIETSWYVPIDDIENIYLELGYDEVTSEALRLGNLLLFAGAQAERLFGQILYPHFVEPTPTLAEQLQDYFVGGLDEMAASSGWKWLSMIAWMEQGVSERQRAAPGHEEAPSLSVLEGLQRLNAHGYRVVMEEAGRGVVYRLEGGYENAPEGDGDQFAKDGDRCGGTNVRSTHNPLCHKGSASEGPVFSVGVVSHNPLCHKGSGQKAAIPIEPGAVFETSMPYAHLGASLATGDFNRDGIDDLVLGAPGYGAAGEPLLGRVAVVYGGTFRTGGDVFEGSADLVLEGDENYARFGWALAVVDLNADGLDDLAVGAPSSGGPDLDQWGRVLVYFGKPEGGLSQEPDLVLEGTERYMRLGYALTAGDVDEDGFVDLLVGSPWARGGGTQRGLAAVFLSRPVLDQATDLTLDDADWQLQGEANYDWFGWHLEVVSRPNSAPLLLIGAPMKNDGDHQSAGRLYGFDMGGVADGQAGIVPFFTLTGDEEFARTGFAFSVGEPMTSGQQLAAIALPTRSWGSSVQVGTVMVVRFDDLRGTLRTNSLDPLSTLLGSEEFARFGWTVRMTDLDKDGLDELLVTSPWHREGKDVETGVVHLWDGGRIPPGLTYEAEVSASSSLFGESLAGRFGSALVALDFDGDGVGDLAISAPQASTGSRLGGAVSVWMDGAGETGRVLGDGGGAANQQPGVEGREPLGRLK